jgi:hypothetical protein
VAPLKAQRQEYAESTVTYGVVTVAAGDVHYGPPPPPFPTGTYELRPEQRPLAPPWETTN